MCVCGGGGEAKNDDSLQKYLYNQKKTGSFLQLTDSIIQKLFMQAKKKKKSMSMD